MATRWIEVPDGIDCDVIKRRIAELQKHIYTHEAVAKLNVGDTIQIKGFTNDPQDPRYVKTGVLKEVNLHNAGHEDGVWVTFPDDGDEKHHFSFRWVKVPKQGEAASTTDDGALGD